MIVSGNGTAVWRNRTYLCALGRSGIRSAKKEGDGATPSGSFAFLRILYRQDRIARPRTSLPATPLSPSAGWCDDPEDSDYNSPVFLPHRASSENLWRSDGLYDVIVVTDHNSCPVVPGNGSAIFVHVAGSDYPPTRGCVAFSLSDLLGILANWSTTDRMTVE